MSNILTPKNRSSSSIFRVRIPSTLAAEIETLKRRAAAHGLSFNANSVCVDALTRAVRQARAELAALEAAERQPEGHAEEAQK